ncbi:MAG: protease modulator HflC [Gammaproteobacteria bacterium]|nr:protease modulator HflC [Gammaproteobacteria bacterium]
MDSKMKLPILLVALGFAAYSFTFVVYEWESAIKLRLGEIVATDYKPGLHFKIPGVNNIIKVDKRIQTLDSRPQRFLTIEKKDVIVDSFVKWRVTDLGQHFRSTGGSSMKAANLLSERINTSLRDEFGKRTIQDVVSGERGEIMGLLRKDADEKGATIGIEVVDVRVKQIDLPPEVSESVYNRMRAERDRVDRDLRAQGAEAAERIRSDADRQRVVILAEAYREAEQMRGEGDSKATEIYAKAFTRDPEFYAFYRSLDAYRKAFANGNNLMVLEPDSEFFRYFKDQNGNSQNGASQNGQSQNGQLQNIN